MAKSETRKRHKRPPADKYRVVIEIARREEAQPLVRQRGLDLVQSEALEDDKGFRLTFFLNDDEIEELRKSGYSLDVGENVSELGLKRQTEIGKGDRFDGGSVAPRGRGVVRKGGHRHGDEGEN